MPISQPPKSRPTSPVEPKTEQKDAGLSPKARQAIGIGGLVACLLVGGGIIYWFLIGSTPKQRTIAVDPKDQRIDTTRMGGGRMTVRPREARGVEKGDNQWVVRGTTGNMVVKRDAGGAYSYSYGFLAPLLSGSQSALPAARYRILNDPAMAEFWQITPEQLDKLKKLEVAPGRFKPSDAQQANLKSLWNAYITSAEGTPREDAQKKLLDTLDEVSKANLDVAKQSASASVEQIKQILTPEQIAKITKP